MLRPEGVQFMQGNEAAAWAAIDAGARFYAGYPITPSSEIAEKCAELLPHFGGVYLQIEDEIASLAAVIGASLSGTKAFTATSGPGFSLRQENLGVAVYQEVPCVVINVMRVGPSTGLATRPAQGDVMQARWGTHGDHPIIVLSPESVQEMYDLTLLAFNLAERYRTPVILLSDEVVGHMREKVVIPPLEKLEIVDRKRPTGDPKEYLPYKPDADLIPPLARYGDEYILHASSTAHDDTGCDAVTIGGNHFIHAARRNVDLTAVIVNNHNYGMTGGQYSATTPLGGRTTTSPRGVAEPPFDVCKLALAAGAPYVARATAYHVGLLKRYLKEAIAKKSFSLVEVLSPCPTYFGRYNGQPSPVAMMNYLKEKAVLRERYEKMPPEEQAKHIPIGVFVDREQPDFLTVYRQMNAVKEGGKNERHLADHPGR